MAQSRCSHVLKVAAPMLLLARPAAAGCSPCGLGGVVAGPSTCEGIASEMTGGAVTCPTEPAGWDALSFPKEGCSCTECQFCPDGQEVVGRSADGQYTGQNYLHDPVGGVCTMGQGLHEGAHSTTLQIGISPEYFQNPGVAQCVAIPCFADLQGQLLFHERIPDGDSGVSCAYKFMESYDAVKSDLEEYDSSPPRAVEACQVASAKLLQEYPQCNPALPRLFSPVGGLAREGGALAALASAAAAMATAVAAATWAAGLRRAGRAARSTERPLVGQEEDAEGSLEGASVSQ